jgi:hypothetical protein
MAIAVGSKTRTWKQREQRYLLDRASAEHTVNTLFNALPTVVYVPGSVVTQVVTTYLDTPAHHYLAIADRSEGLRTLKVRVREYQAISRDSGQVTSTRDCYLERKERVNEVRIKQRVEIGKSELAGILDQDKALNGSNAAKAITGELSTLDLRPALVSSYRRIVFGDEDNLRVTFDEQLAYYKPPPGLYESNDALTFDVLGEPIARGPKRILEIKIPEHAEIPEWLAALVADIPDANGFSKFRAGMHAVQRTDGKPVRLSRSLVAMKVQ